MDDWESRNEIAVKEKLRNLLKSNKNGLELIKHTNDEYENALQELKQKRAELKG